MTKLRMDLTVALMLTLVAPCRADDTTGTNPFNLAMPKEMGIQKYPGSKLLSVSDFGGPTAAGSAEVREDRVWCEFRAKTPNSVMDFYRNWLANNRWKIDTDTTGEPQGTLQATSGQYIFELDYCTTAAAGKSSGFPQTTVPGSQIFFLSGSCSPQCADNSSPFAPFPQCPGTESMRVQKKSRVIAEASGAGAKPAGSGLIVEQSSTDSRARVLEYYKTKLDDGGWIVRVENNWTGLTATKGTTVMDIRYDDTNSSKFRMKLTRQD